MAGIYIHIPFCRRKCHYCNFFSVASQRYKSKFLDALKEEIFLQRNYLSGEPVQSLYFGGGTPSLCSGEEIRLILEEIKKYYVLENDVEITLEANPDDITKKLLNEYLNIGINRISIGIQSFYNDDLEYLNRIHSGEQGLEAIRQAQEEGFRNISIDLIYGIPTLTDEKWVRNLDTALSLDIQHISAYALTVEPKTALDVFIRKGIAIAPDEDRAADHFTILIKKMRENGFIQYEISNFGQEGFFSRHNSLYWSRVHYFGLGPSAHSFNGDTRQWNVASIIEYIDQINRGEKYFESETLTTIQKYNEYVMTSLRTMWGLDLVQVRNTFGEAFSSRVTRHASRFIRTGRMTEKEGIYYLTDKGKFFADGIAAELFVSEEEEL